MQRMMAAALVVAGVFVLFGTGWSLLVAGTLLWFRDDRAAAWVTERRSRIAAWGSSAVAKVRELPRRVLAGSTMGVGIAVVPAGAAVVWGAGVALVVAGVALIGFSLLTGWGA